MQLSVEMQQSSDVISVLHDCDVVADQLVFQRPDSGINIAVFSFSCQSSPVPELTSASAHVSVGLSPQMCSQYSS